MDPLTPDYPWYTPYQFAGNTPIAAIDLDGLENFMTTDGNYIGAGPLSGSTILANHLKPTTEFEYAYKGQTHAELAVKNMQLRDMTYSGPQAYISQYQPTLDFGQQVARQLVTSAPVVAEELAELPYLAYYATKGYITGDYTDAVYQAAAIFMPGVSMKSIKGLKQTIDGVLLSGDNIKVTRRLKDQSGEREILDIPYGFKEVPNEYSMGQKIYRSGSVYISPDVTGHNPNGWWKAAPTLKGLQSGNSDLRFGTYDKEFKKIGD